MHPLRQTLEAALAHHQAGRHDQAAELYRRVLAAAPEDFDAQHYYGLLLHQIGQTELALPLLRASVWHHPEHAGFHGNLARVLLDHFLLQEAMVEFRSALTLDPNMASAHLGLSQALRRSGSPEAALDAAEAALKLVPGWPEARFAIAAALMRLNRLDEAIAGFLALTKEHGDITEAQRYLASCLLDMGDVEQAVAVLHDYIGRRDHDAPAVSDYLFALQHSGAVSAGDAFARQQAAVAACDPWQLHAAPANVAGCGERRPAIGLICGDFNDRVTRFFLLPLIEALDHSRLRWFAYHNGPWDEYTRRYEAAGLHVVDIRRESDERVAARIRADGVAVLIDLAVHTGLNRLGVLAQRAAPIQMTWMGYAASSGIAAIDWRISDMRIDPPGLTEHLHSEALLRLPVYVPFQMAHTPAGAARLRLPVYVPFQMPADGPDSRLPPSLTGGRVTFGAFNRPAKSAPMRACWAELLVRLPDAQLQLYGPDPHSSPQSHAWYLEPFRQRAVADRVSLWPRQPFNRFLQTVAAVDIALDSYPYAGGVTSFHTLSQGVPVVTLAGEAPISRVTASLVESLGYGEWVATTHEQYLACAQQLAGAPERLVQIRQQLPQQLAASPWCQIDDFAREFERVLEALMATKLPA